MNQDIERGHSNLWFGEETFLMGEVSTEANAVVQRTRFAAKLGMGSFDVSTNPSWSAGTPVHITEVGIYDDEDNLVAIGKLATPIEKKSGSMVVLVVDMDF